MAMRSHQTPCVRLLTLGCGLRTVEPASLRISIPRSIAAPGWFFVMKSSLT
ncbi:hypothetical protein D3C74_441680 [compost metagenome]